jgi:hypothetical protein
MDERSNIEVRKPISRKFSNLSDTRDMKTPLPLEVFTDFV